MTFVQTHRVCPAPHQVPSLREKQRKNPTKEKSKRAAAPTWGGHWPSGRPAPGPHGGRLAYGLRAARLRTPLPTLVCSKTWPRNGVPGAEQHTRLCGGPGPIPSPPGHLDHGCSGRNRAANCPRGGRSRDGGAGGAWSLGLGSVALPGPLTRACSAATLTASHAPSLAGWDRPLHDHRAKAVGSPDIHWGSFWSEEGGQRRNEGARAAPEPVFPRGHPKPAHHHPPGVWSLVVPDLLAQAPPAVSAPAGLLEVAQRPDQGFCAAVHGGRSGHSAGASRRDLTSQARSRSAERAGRRPVALRWVRTLPRPQRHPRWGQRRGDRGELGLRM